MFSTQRIRETWKALFPKREKMTCLDCATTWTIRANASKEVKRVRDYKCQSGPFSEQAKKQQQKAVLLWSILRHLKDVQGPNWDKPWIKRRISEHRLEGDHLMKELSLLLLPFSQRTVPWMVESDTTVQEDLEKISRDINSMEPPLFKESGGKMLDAVKLKLEEDGKTPLPKEERKCTTPGCFSHDPPKEFEPNMVISICNLNELMGDVKAKEEKFQMATCCYCNLSYQQERDVNNPYCPTCVAAQRRR